jgi:predicted esterase
MALTRALISALLTSAIAWYAAEAQVTTDVAFTATYDGTTQSYIQILPASFDTLVTHDMMIALHGAGSDRWQFATDTRDECRAARDAATQNDMIYISPDYRGSTSFMGIAAEADVVQIIHDLRARYRVNRTFITGASMGGMSCLTFAELHPDMIDGVASMNGTGNFFEWPGWPWGPIETSFGGTMADFPQGYLARSAEFWPQRFVMPVGITASGGDDIVPPQSAMRLACALKDLGKTVLSIFEPTMGHSTNYADGKAILDFVIAAWTESVPPLVSTQPHNVNVMEGGQVSFTVIADRGHFYAWQRNGVSIPDALLSSLTFAASLADNGAKFRCMVRNNKGRDTSDEATLTVTPDTTVPRIASAIGAPATVTVIFSEGVDGATALRTANYSISGGVSVVAAVFAPNNTFYRGVYDSLPANAIAAIAPKPSDRAVILTVAGMVAGTTYAVTANGIRDLASAPNTLTTGSQYSFQATSGELPNHDFESGDLSGWTIASGTAFSACEVANVAGSYGGRGTYCLYAQNCWTADAPFGILRSAPFTISGPGVIDALVSGGYEPGALYFALVRASDGAILYRAMSNSRSNNFVRVTYDASSYIGTQAYVQLVDSSSTVDWGHINLDDVNVFRTAAPPVAADRLTPVARSSVPAFAAAIGPAGSIVLHNVPPAMSADRSLRIRIADVSGRLAYNLEVRGNNTVLRQRSPMPLPGSQLTAGCYVVTASTDCGGSLHARLIVR